MHSELISETHDEAGLGIKVRVFQALDRSGLQAMGEAWASGARNRADRIWVWVYGPDMDPDGPALSVTYVESGYGPTFTFVPASTILLYYLGDSTLTDPQGHRPIYA